MRKKYSTIERDGQLLFTEDGWALSSDDVLERLRAAGEGRNPREQLHDALQAMADRGVMVSRVSADYVQRDDGSGLLVSVETEEKRNA